jgi:retinol dehydrogenase 12
LQSEKNYSPWKVYAKSKLANVLFSAELAKRYKGLCFINDVSKIKSSNMKVVFFFIVIAFGITAVSLHPGVVRTDLIRNVFAERPKLYLQIFNALQFIWLIFSKTAIQGAQTTIHCAVDDDIPGQSGCFFT